MLTENAAAAQPVPRQGGRSAGSRAPLIVAAVGLTAATAALLISLISGPFSLAAGTDQTLGLRLTTLSCSLLVLIGGLGLVVQSFVCRYSVDDPRLRRLQSLLLAAMAGSALVAASASLLVLTAGWLITSVALAGLLAHRPDGQASGRTLRPALLALLATDLSLLAATVIVTASAGDVRLDALSGASAELAGTTVGDVDAHALVAVLIVIAALGRSAQIPFRSWLAQTIAVPTPISALLHAGIVNAGGVLIILTAPLVTESSVAMWLLWAVAGTTMLYGTSLMIARPDVKGALVLSTRGQMAFMLLQCAIGAFAAAIFHLIAHGMYKATLFLGAGSVIDESRVLARAPHPPLPAARGARALRQALPALAVPAVLIVVAVTVVSPGLSDDRGAILLLGFAWASAAQASWWWLRLREPSGAGRAIALAALAAAIFIYVGLLGGAKDLLAPDIPAAGDGVVPVALLAPVLALALAATALRWLAAALPSGGARLGRFGRLQRRLYARALSDGAWPPRGSLGAPLARRLRRAPGSSGNPRPVLGVGE